MQGSLSRRRLGLAPISLALCASVAMAADEWAVLADKSFNVLMECYYRQFVNAHVSRADEKALLLVVHSFCREQRSIHSEIVVTIRRSMGDSQAEAQRVAANILAHADGLMVRSYADWRAKNH